MEKKFKEGDIVCLKSGGPEMTVKSIDGGVIYCVWFDNQDKLHHESFFDNTIELAEDDE